MKLKIKLCDYITDFLVKKGIEHVFMITGGGAIGLQEAIFRNESLKTIFNHHEQAGSMGAVGYYKCSKRIAAVFPTTGCGGTNCITGLLDAWQDSVPVIYVSGNVNLKQTTRYQRLNHNIRLRKLGIQEADIIEIVKSITKYSVFLDNPNNIDYELNKAYYLATSGRFGPVWIDIPSDLQTVTIETEDIVDNFDYFPDVLENEHLFTDKNFKAFDLLKKDLLFRRRPIVLAGNGIHLSNTENKFQTFIEKYNLPFVTTYLGIDIIGNHKNNIGVVGVKGDRAGNFALNNADLVLVLGSCLNTSITGYNYQFFAPKAKKIVVDIDRDEHIKNTVKIDSFIRGDLNQFFDYFNENK